MNSATSAQARERSIRPSRTPIVTIGDLVAAVPSLRLVSGDPLTPLGGVTLDSRGVLPGDLYAALPGSNTHGSRFAGDAIAAGAAAILSDAAEAQSIASTGAPTLVADDPRAALGLIAAVIFGTRENAPDIYAVTGTNGKTTTSYLIKSLLEGLGHTTGLISSIEILAGHRPVAAIRTTPEAPELHAILAQMAESDISAAAIEVTSHALALHRFSGVSARVSGFTNLSHDHLDLHGTMADYASTKAQLLSPSLSQRAVVTIDDEWGLTLANEAAIPVARLLTRPARPGEHADYVVSAVHAFETGSSFDLTTPSGLVITARTRLPSFFNVSNAALAIAMVIEGGATAEAVAALLADRPDALSPTVLGRMQLVHTAPQVIVDFAHNPDALHRVLESVVPLGGRRIVVFGAAGERDRTKRRVMGEIAARGADIVIVTDDDPHNEDPAAIRAEVMEGAVAAAGASTEVYEIAPRAAAIAEAARLCRPDDVVIIAGRGHEQFQSFGDTQVQIDDGDEFCRAITELRSVAGTPTHT